jgi:hypothetical protein
VLSVLVTSKYVEIHVGHVSTFSVAPVTTVDVERILSTCNLVLSEKNAEIGSENFK